MSCWIVYCPDEKIGFIPQFYDSYEKALKFVEACADQLPLEIFEDWFEPNDYDGDIGSATIKEMRMQNGDY